MKKYILIIAIIGMIVSSCDDDETYNTVLDCGQTFFVVDKDGNDLLDPSHPHAITASQIKIIYNINGERMPAVKYFQMMSKDAILYNYDGFSIHEPGPGIETYSLGVLFDESVRQNGGISTIYIEWNGTDTDTIKAQVSIANNGNYYVSKMVSYNDFVWSPTQEDFIFTIVK